MAHHGHHEKVHETKLKPGHKYPRVAQVGILSKKQKKAQSKLMERVKPGKFKTPAFMKQGLGFLGGAMKHGAPISPIEGTGQTFLQGLLGRSPEEHLRDFEAPYLRRFQEEIAPGIAEKYGGAGMLSGSGFQNAMMGAGAGLTENLASLKANLINQLLGQQIQGANVGLGYAQLPGQRFGQQLEAANMGIPLSMRPQEAQTQMNQYAQGLRAQQLGGVMGQPGFQNIGVPPQPRQPGFWGGLAGGGGGGGLAGVLGGLGGIAPGLLAGGHPDIGGAVTGALGGAAAGTAVLPGIGTGIGALWGGLLGLFNGGGGGGGGGGAHSQISAPETSPGFF